jgi:acyl-CoA thioesterase YciA
MNNFKSSQQPTIRTIPSHSDLNSNGHIFGGWILARMDEAGGIAAIRYAEGPVATVAIEAIKFHKPMLPGDWMSIYTNIKKVGITSLTIHIEVTALRRGEEKETLVTQGDFTFVALDEDHKPLEIKKKNK